MFLKTGTFFVSQPLSSKVESIEQNAAKHEQKNRKSRAWIELRLLFHQDLGQIQIPLNAKHVESQIGEEFRSHSVGRIMYCEINLPTMYIFLL